MGSRGAGALQRDCHTPFMNAGSRACGVRPKTQAITVFGQESLSVVALTLAAMTALEARDAATAPPEGKGEGCAEPSLSGAQHRDRVRGAADRLRGDGRRDGDARRGAGARRGVVVRVRVLGVFHDEPVRDGVRLPVGGPRRAPGTADHGDHGLRGGPAAVRDGRDHVAVPSRAGGAGARRRAGRRGVVRRRGAGLPGAAAPGDHGGVRGELGDSVRGRTVDRGHGHRAPGLAVGVHRDTGAGRVSAGARAAADTPAVVRAVGGRGDRRSRALRAAAYPAGARDLARLRTPPVRRPGPGPALPRPRPRGRRAARPGRPRAAAARHLPGGARAAVRGAAARAGRRCLHRRRVLCAPHAGHPARAVADARRVLPRGGRMGPGRWGRMCSRGHARSRTGTG